MASSLSRAWDESRSAGRAEGNMVSGCTMMTELTPEACQAELVHRIRWTEWPKVTPAGKMTTECV